MEKRVISTQVQEEDMQTEFSLRPMSLEEYVGQEKIKSTLRVYIEAACQRQEPLDHVLFYGPPGLGKTTLSGIIANEMACTYEDHLRTGDRKARRDGFYS